MGNDTIDQTKPVLRFEDLNPMPLVPISPEELEDMKKYFEELLEQDGDSSGINPDAVTDKLKEEFKIPEEVCTSIEAKIQIASEYGDVTTIEIEAIICEEFGVNNFDELNDLLENAPSNTEGGVSSPDSDKPLSDGINRPYLEDDKPDSFTGGHFKALEM